ncbi:MAG: alpha/beta hydrolase [Bryobacterales bacterium]|nr:alpha/beta hydrolase [Bryobacterales bacterium]
MLQRILIWSVLLAVPLLARVDRDQVYAMRGGLAMLMDVHYPERSNGFGIVFISGSGWHAPLRYDASPLKGSGFARLYAPPLTSAGFTVFVINHRAAPRYRYPAPLEDAQRAVRFVRHHADRFGIDPDRIGGVGGSSGGHLASMLGVLDGGGRSDDADPVERQSSKVQAVVARAAPTDLTRFEGRFSSASVASLLGLRLGARDPRGSAEFRRHWEASPTAHVSPDDPPFLLVHGTADERVPFARAEEFAAMLRAVNVPARLLPIEGGGHGPSFPGATDPPDYLGAMVDFFREHLSGDSPPEREVPQSADAESDVKRNVVFGMVSGGALLMDVHRPNAASSNGLGIIHITGSGWHSPIAASAPQQKASRQVEIFGKPLVEAGYTLYAVNHRTAPLNKYPAQLEDVERAVRFVRHHASRWGIDPSRIGGIGGSSGGHLILMLGLRQAAGLKNDPDLVNRENAALQTIVPWAPPTDLIRHNGEFGTGTFGSLFGLRLMARDPRSSPQRRAYLEASPIEHVSSADPPTLLIHGDADAIVPIEHSRLLLEELRKSNVPSELLVVPGGGHGAAFPGKASDSPDYVSEAVRWFDRHLASRSAKQAQADTTADPP